MNDPTTLLLLLLLVHLTDRVMDHVLITSDNSFSHHTSLHVYSFLQWVTEHLSSNSFPSDLCSSDQSCERYYCSLLLSDWTSYLTKYYFCSPCLDSPNLSPRPLLCFLYLSH